MNAPTAPLLSMEKMTKRFGGLIAVDKLDLEVREGAIHSIIGPNGAGKTTVFNCIMEFYIPDEGAIWFAGERIDGVTPDRVAEAGISRTYQNIRLFRNLTAMENILVGSISTSRRPGTGPCSTRAPRGATRPTPMTKREGSSNSSVCAAAATWLRGTWLMASSGALK